MPDCEGLGEIVDIDLEVFLDRSRSLNEGALRHPTYKVGSHDWYLFIASGRLDPDKPVGEYSAIELHDLLHATGGTVPVEINNSVVNMSYEGALVKFRRRYLNQDVSEKTRQVANRFTTVVPCPACGGTRLSQVALGSRIKGYNIADLAALEAGDLLGVLETFDLPAVEPVLDALRRQVGHLVEIGLGYLSLDRRTATLSGGEAQRVKLVRQLSSSLNDLLYIFDEPSIGLHPRDVHRLTSLLYTLRDKGNTVLVVEHDRDVIAAADHVIDIGPGAGVSGGRLVFAGTVAELRTADTPTGRGLTAPTRLKATTREPNGVLRVTGARDHNLRDLTVEIPAGVLTAIAGVAGAGKSSLINGSFRAQHPDAVLIDQSPPHANRRSTVITSTGIADGIRTAFAKANGVAASLFSANSSGACSACNGLGETTVDLGALEGISLVCQTCDGKRFGEDVLRYELRGRTISDVLELTVAEGREFFAKSKRIAAVLAALADVGLDYLRLGQPLTSLSGGECQRLKLANQLHERRTTYVLDEPTTGLHLADVERLLGVLDRLVDEYAATVLVIEHNLDVIAHADWVVELGPEGGSRGGQLVYEGTPRGLAESGTATGIHLRKALG